MGAPTKLLVGLSGALVIGAACAPASNTPTFPVGHTAKFIVQVVHTGFDVGRAGALAIDSKGTPTVSYILVSPVPRPSVLPDIIVAGAPQPPSVMIATDPKGIWERTAVTGQPPVGAAVGKAPEIANDQGYAVPGVATAIAVDSGDKHHVVWSTPKGGVFYATDQSGSFGTPEKITPDQAFGASIAVAPDGTPWVSYFRGATLEVASRTGGAWQVQDVVTIAGAAGLPAVRTAIGVTPSGDPVVAYGDNGATVVAEPRVVPSPAPGTTQLKVWLAINVPGPGGYGVSLALDRDGNPHVAYYDAKGGVHHAHSVGGSAWMVDDLGTTSAGPNGQGDPRWATGIAVDQQGIHYVTWADTAAGDVVLATNASGSFAAQALPDSQAGWTPSIAVSGDGKSLAISWFDSVNLNLDVATPATGTLVALAHATPTLQQPSVPPPTASCSPSGTSLAISAQGITFDTNCLAAPAGTAFTIAFNNKDAGVPHNLEIFTDSTATQRLGGATGITDIITGPGIVNYSVDALQAGTYFFRCDIHPTQMTGTFVVSK